MASSVPSEDDIGRRILLHFDAGSNATLTQEGKFTRFIRDINKCPQRWFRRFAAAARRYNLSDRSRSGRPIEF